MPVSEELKDKLAHFSNLPTLPQVAARLLGMINNPLTSASDVAFVVGQDLSLSAKVLRLSNSAFYGIPRSITSIHNAVVILGLKVINTMVLSLTVFDMFPEEQKNTPLFDRKAFWIHSLACGLIAKYLAPRIKKVILFDPEEAFCAGLLHDIGKVVMEQYLHEDFHRTLTYASENSKTMFEAETELLCFTHNDIADYLTETWNLPAEIRQALIYHHLPGKTTQYYDIVALCHIADWLCYETGVIIDKAFAPPQLDPSTMEHLKIDEDDIEYIKSTIPEEIEKTSIFLNVAKE